MRLLRRSNTGEFSLTRNFIGDEPIPPYAILSHTWGPDTVEVTFNDLTNGCGKDKSGYEKIRFCGRQAEQDGLQYFWIDTCCINKANKAELSQAINAMFRWYRNATQCYVYLSDVSTAKRKSDNEFIECTWEQTFRESRWFTRGWTLQELLAPSSVVFFSRDGKRLGDKSSLCQQIHEITVIPKSALQGVPLSAFPVNERFSWMQPRETKLEEDKAYSLLGIFGVYVPPVYGEGLASSFKRLREEIGKLEQCMQDLHLTNPWDDKKRIEDSKGGLLKDSYRWILENPDFQRWRDDQQSRLLWIKGDPGKGKTMLLCGIANELMSSMAKTSLLSYFFCQATDSRINSATTVLRGLLYMLVHQQPSLISHIRKKHDHAGKALFEDVNAWVALSEIFTDVLQDPSLKDTYLIVDALGECVIRLPKLLDFVVQTSCMSSRVNSDDADLCKGILALMGIVYRPLTLNELACLSEELKDMADDLDSLQQIVGLCGSFLTVQNGTVYFVHQSAKDFLCTGAVSEIFPSGTENVHFTVFSRSLEVMSKTLRRDMYSLRALGYPAEQVEPPDPDPLAASRYSCIYWVDHLCDWCLNSSATSLVNLQDGGTVYEFLRKKYLYWLEALSLCKSMSKGGREDASKLIELVLDARRFVMAHKWAIENCPLQAYASALVFSPACSVVRDHFKEEEPQWITVKPSIGDQWSACLRTLEGHSGGVRSVAFSHDSARLASASSDKTVKIWDASSGACLRTFSIGKPLNDIAFDHTGVYLHTNIGTIDISVQSGLTSFPTIPEPRSPQYQGIALSADGVWITHNSEHQVWLPSEYRPSCSVVSRNTIGIGVGSGKVWICKVELCLL
ncbi:HET-domain-containing protein [Lentithecium fluviatile CBS 122367]|uniref:HET-domain-containing protein n=1 Tax=Lentithecium fluviatile CBS 122367 TaxID=1168545 RepID=A0A6G1JLP6_9PLEO|nr:HET-domain-containing protein [Lentithecium fluviatile CBS 122367]